jgi:hypothetical protein
MKTQMKIIDSVLGFNMESSIVGQANKTIYPKVTVKHKSTNDPKAKHFFTNYNSGLLEKIRNSREQH